MSDAPEAGPFEEPADAEPDGPARDPGADADDRKVTDPTAPPEPDKPFNVYGLRNTEGDLDPAELAAELDPDAGPEGHLLAGLGKQIEAGGVEAWMHYVFAAYLLLDPDANLLDRDADDGGDDADGDDPGRADRWGTVE